MRTGPRPLLRDALVVLGTLGVLGVLGGVLWSQLVTPAEFTKVSGGGAMGESDFAKRFGAEAWYVVVGLVGGLLAGLVLTWWRSRDPLATGLLLLLGSVLAGVLTVLVGHLLGPPDPAAALRAARAGATVPESLQLSDRPWWPPGAYLRDTLPVNLAWPAGVLVGALVVLAVRGPWPGAPRPTGETSGPDEQTDPADSSVPGGTSR